MTIHFTAALWVTLLGLVGYEENAGDRRVASWVDQRVEAMQPTPDERRIDRIGWARDIRSALRLGREHGRPVFLFTMDGRFSIGRC